jgi:hypothetical protein
MNVVWDAIKASKLNPTEKLVLAFLFDKADANGVVWWGVRSIRVALGLSRDQVVRALDVLRRAGHIVEIDRSEYRDGGRRIVRVERATPVGGGHVSTHYLVVSDSSENRLTNPTVEASDHSDGSPREPSDLSGEPSDSCVGTVGFVRRESSSNPHEAKRSEDEEEEEVAGNGETSAGAPAPPPGDIVSRDAALAMIDRVVGPFVKSRRTTYSRAKLIEPVQSFIASGRTESALIDCVNGVGAIKQSATGMLVKHITDAAGEPISEAEQAVIDADLARDSAHTGGSLLAGDVDQERAAAAMEQHFPELWDMLPKELAAMTVDEVQLVEKVAKRQIPTSALDEISR